MTDLRETWRQRRGKARVMLTPEAGHGKIETRIVLDAQQFHRQLRRALWEGSFGEFCDYQRQLGRDSLRVTVERTERRLFGYTGAHRGED